MNTKSHTEDLGSLSIGRLLAKIAIPSSVALFVTSTYNLVDAVFVGRSVGPAGIGALTLVQPLQFLVTSFGSLIAVGGASIVSRALGGGDERRAQRATGSAFFVSLVSGLIFTMTGILLLDRLIRVLGAVGELVPLTHDYLGIILFLEPILLFNYVANSMMRAEGQARIAMVIMVAGMLLNIALDPLFIFVFGWGVKGAAIATLIGRCGTLGLSILYFVGNHSSLKIGFFDLRPNGKILWEIVTVGTSAFIRQAGSSFADALRNNLLITYGGAIFMSAFGAVFRVMIFLGMPGMGIAHAVQPIAGYNYGAGNLRRVRQSVWVSIGVCTIFMMVGFTITQLLPGPLLRLFTSEHSMVRQGIPMMRITSLLFLFFPAYIIAPSFYQALGKPGRALVLSLARPILGAIFMVAGARLFDVIGVVVADPVAMALSALFAIAYLRLSMRRLRMPEQRPQHQRR